MISTKFKPGDKVGSVYGVELVVSLEEIIKDLGNNHGFLHTVTDSSMSLVLTKANDGIPGSFRAICETLVNIIENGKEISDIGLSKKCICDFRSVVMVTGCQCGGS